jgi:CSLREA domain-containing protein
MKTSPSITVVIASLLLLACATARATVVTNIADGDVAGLKAAITSANSNGDDDIINLAANGTYTLTTVDNTDSAPGLDGTNGLPIIKRDGGHSLTINGNDATITRSSASGTPEFRIIEIDGAVASVSGVTFSNGLLSFYDATAAAMVTWSSDQNGRSTVALSNCNFTGNLLSNPNTSVGGAIYNVRSTLTLTNCYLNSNAAGGQVSLGGAIFNGDPATLTVINSTFYQNSATIGGALENYDTMTVINSTIANNGGQSNGGGIDTIGSQLTLINDTISGNMLAQGGAGGGISYQAGTSVVLQNTIVAGNSAPQSPDVASHNGSSAVTSHGHNLIGKTDGSSGWIASDLTGTVATPLDPHLGPLQSRGGPAPTMSLLANSPAIDAGDDSVLDAPLNLTSDERGFPRRIGTHVDIGAYELDHAQTGSTLTVNTTLDGADDTCGETRCTLRDAINTANAAGGGNTVDFAPGLGGTITLTQGELDILSAVTIIGPGARILSVDANLASRVLRIDQVGAGTTVAISGLTFTRGHVINDSGVSFNNDQLGGAIINLANTTLTDCAITDSFAIGTPGQIGFGGGISNARDGTLTLAGCTISGNSAIGGSFPSKSNSTTSGGPAYGGGFYNQRVGGATLRNCTFSGNMAQGGRGSHNGRGQGGAGGDGVGGAILNDSQTSTFTVTNCTFSANAAIGGSGGTGKPGSPAGPAGTGQAGGIYNEESNPAQVGNTLIAGNSGTGGGSPDVNGAFFSVGSNLIGKTDGSTGFTDTTDLTGTSAMPRDPNIGPLANNGGPTDTVALLAGSLAINAGRDAKAPLRDQRGYARSGVSDIGAFELNGHPLRITNLARQGNNLVVTFTAVKTESYRLEREPAITDQNWQSIAGVPDVTAMATGSGHITDTSSPFSMGKAFYRIRVLP